MRKGDTEQRPQDVQAIVGGDFELYAGPDGTRVLAPAIPASTDKYNYFATRLARGLMPDDRLMGTCVVIGRPIEIGGDSEVPERVIEKVLQWVEARR
jgi:hypothetical protein